MGVILRAHPVRELHIQRNANQEVTTRVVGIGVCAYMLIQACHFVHCACHVTTSNSHVPLRAK